MPASREMRESTAEGMVNFEHKPVGKREAYEFRELLPYTFALPSTSMELLGLQ